MNILIWGFGLEGRSTLDYFLKEGINKNNIYIATKDKIEIDGIKCILEENILDYINEIDLVVKSSGISFYKKEVQELIKKNIKITTNLNILLENNKSKTIAITGTKGKSTTSSMLYHILKNLGYNVALVGNIGKSFLDIIDINYDYIVLELSSYQVKTLYNNLDYSIILNLFKEHIDWHLKHENYFKDKLSISNHSKKCIYNSNNELIKKYLKIDNNFVEFGNNKNFHIKDNFIYFNNEKIIDINNFNNIKGEHIFRNICVILTFLKEENIDINKSLEILKTFKTLEHRLDIFYNKNNTMFIDDSISTIPEATIEALKTFNNKDVFLILGGFDRKQDYTLLVDFIKKSNNIKKIYLLGQTGLILNKLLPNSTYYNSLKDIVDSIKKEDLNNKIVLLSPASPSYDMFKNFEERGSIFKELMLK